jgi:uncharacterized protein YndB with AHSA1/START domain
MTTLRLQPARSVADVTAGVILATVEIAAPMERVFRALTEPNEIARWWGSPDTYRTEQFTADLRVGGRWEARGRGADGRPFGVGGEFREVDPPRKLVQTWAPDWEAGLVTTLSYRLDPIEGGTRVTVRHEGFGDHRDACRDHGQGWERVLGWLREHASASERSRRVPLRGSLKMQLLSGLYWITGVLIGLGAFGHGFGGVKPVRAALAAVPLPADVRQVIWIVWYDVSGTMLLFGGLIIGAWFAARRGQSQALVVPIVIALFYITTGIAAYTYQRNPFWLVFLVLGGLLLIATLGLRGALRAQTPAS